MCVSGGGAWRLLERPLWCKCRIASISGPGAHTDLLMRTVRFIDAPFVAVDQRVTCSTSLSSRVSIRNQLQASNTSNVVRTRQRIRTGLSSSGHSRAVPPHDRLALRTRYVESNSEEELENTSASLNIKHIVLPAPTDIASAASPMMSSVHR